MTAEIAVLNKDAVALAADSTVTVTGSKTFHSTNKLFALSSKHAVGMMVYGSSELGGIPWEALIKLYRNQVSNTFHDSLFDYRDEFITFLENDVNQYSAEEQKHAFFAYVDDYLDVLIDAIDSSVDKKIHKSGSIEDSQVAALVRKTIDQHYDIWMDEELLPFATNDLLETLKKEYSKSIDHEISKKLEKHRISKVRRKKIIDICIRIFATTFEEVTGIVVAGFGEKELFPTSIACHVEGIFFGKLKFECTSVEIDNSDLNAAAVVPFAVRDVATLFMEGISGVMLKCVKEGAVRILSDQIDHVIATLESEQIDQTVIESVTSQLAEEGPEFLETLSRYIESKRYGSHIKPVLDAVEFLPKSEMAEVAESLVSITSFRQKISLDKESVGGDVDVAVISKSDGFIWIKRKNYFTSELNPHKSFEASC